jgi:phospholipid transport system substrate-binding protein
VHELLSEGFDLPSLARLSLGRFWRAASEAQRTEFQQLFAAFLTNLYANSLERDPDDPPVVTGFGIDRVRSEPPQEYVVLTHFERPAGQPFRVEWRVRSGAEDHRVVDVSVEGISMVVLFRQMLATAVHEGGGDVEGLLARLRDMVGEPTPAPLSAIDPVE